MHWDQSQSLVFIGTTSKIQEPLYLLPPANRNNYVVGVFVIVISTLILLLGTPIGDILSFLKSYTRFFCALLFVFGLLITLTAPLNWDVIKRRRKTKRKKKQ